MKLFTIEFGYAHHSASPSKHIDARSGYAEALAEAYNVAMTSKSFIDVYLLEFGIIGMDKKTKAARVWLPEAGTTPLWMFYNGATPDSPPTDDPNDKPTTRTRFLQAGYGVLQMLESMGIKDGDVFNELGLALAEVEGLADLAAMYRRKLAQDI